MKHRLALVIFAAMTLFFAPFNGTGQTSPKARLNHIAIYVVDLKISSDFYQQVIGLDTIPEPFHDGRHTWFSIGPQSHLHVISGAETKTTHNKNAHLCFSVPSIDKFIQQLNQKKIPYETGPVRNNRSPNE